MTTTPTTTATPITTVTLGVPADLLNPAVTQATIAPTICTPGWTATIRPPTSITGPIKTAQIASYGYADTDPANYEEDHVIALSLGGAPSAPANLFPQPETTRGGDDGLESYLKAKVCSAALPLDAAQQQLYASKVSHGYDYAKSTSVAAGSAGPSPALASPASPPSTVVTGGSYYSNCTAARAAGVAPLHSGDAGYRPALDRDADGIACE